MQMLTLQGSVETNRFEDVARAVAQGFDRGVARGLREVVVEGTSTTSSSRAAIAKYNNKLEYGDKRSCPELTKMGVEAGRLSRYHNDPDIRYEQFEALYASWIQNSVDRTAADVVLVAKRDEVLAGVVTVKADTEN